ncbi:type II secretion system protein GspC [Aliidiomarina sp. Khilg15.8]
MIIKAVFQNQPQLQSFLTPARLHRGAIALACVLAVLAAWWLAQLTWQIFTPAADPVVTTATRTAKVQPAERVDVSAIQNLKLFGDRTAPAARQAGLDAPETTLNIRLVGLSASADALRSAAIIEQGGNQQTYIIGERIANSRATVEAIFPDRVILDNNGRREALYVEGRDGFEAQLQIAMQGAPAGREEAARTEAIELPASEEMESAVARLRENPTELLEFISVTPVRQGGQILGYRLQPRQSPELFAAIGLQPGDVAVMINGYDLTDAAQAMAAMSELQDASNAIVQVRRDNDIVDLELRVPER